MDQQANLGFIKTGQDANTSGSCVFNSCSYCSSVPDLEIEWIANSMILSQIAGDWAQLPNCLNFGTEKLRNAFFVATILYLRTNPGTLSTSGSTSWLRLHLPRLALASALCARMISYRPHPVGDETRKATTVDTWSSPIASRMNTPPKNFHALVTQACLVNPNSKKPPWYLHHRLLSSIPPAPRYPKSASSSGNLAAGLPPGGVSIGLGGVYTPLS
jgi:hypothetical protein